MTRATAFGLGLITVAMFAWGAFAQLDGPYHEWEPTWQAPDDAMRQRLCHNGHPIKRSQHLTYGGLETVKGYRRNHQIPLCLGGLDIAVPYPIQPPSRTNPGNVWYEPLNEAKADDRRERRACKDYCAGRITLEDARKEFEK